METVLLRVIESAKDLESISRICKSNKNMRSICIGQRQVICKSVLRNNGYTLSKKYAGSYCKIVKFFYENEWGRNLFHYFLEASKGNNTFIMDFIMEQHYDLNGNEGFELVENAKSGNLYSVRYIIEKGGKTGIAEALYASGLEEEIDVFKYLYPFVDTDERTDALENVFVTLSKNRVRWIESTAKRTISSHSQYFSWLFR